MTHSDFQAEINRWRPGPYQLRPTCISGYDTPAGARYSAVWEKQTGASWSSDHGMTDVEFHERSGLLTNWSQFPVFVSGFNRGGVRYYNAIWESFAQGDAVTVVGASRTTLDSLNTLRKAQGYALTHVSTFTEDDLPRYNAVWTRGTFGRLDEFEVRYGLTAAQYREQGSSGLVHSGLNRAIQSQAGDMNQVDQLDAATLISNANEPTARNNPDEVRMLNLELTLVRQTDRERPKGRILAGFPDLFRCHAINLTAGAYSVEPLIEWLNKATKRFQLRSPFETGSLPPWICWICIHFMKPTARFSVNCAVAKSCAPTETWNKNMPPSPNRPLSLT